MKLWKRVIPILISAGCFAAAQNESRLHSDFRKEGDALKACAKFTFGNLTDCAQTLLMGQPVHIAVGSLAPDNGVGVGLAFVEHKDFTNEWRAGWDADGLATTNNSWRAGVYMTAYRLPAGLQYRVAPLFHLYSQSISLNRVDYFGLGPATPGSAQSTFGFSENITGVHAAIPFKVGRGGPRFAIVAEANGRFPSVRAGTTSGLPSITQLYTESTAPGLVRQPSYFQPGLGIRIYPALFQDRVRLDYLVEAQDFYAPGDKAYSFRRWTGDFNHELPLYSWLPGKAGKRYSNVRTPVINHNGPDNCTGANVGLPPSRQGAKINPAVPCPVVSETQKLEGSIRLRAFLVESAAGAGSAVPFYYSPTLGGSDLNGTTMLASYQDYRFRGPNLLLFRGEFEHSLGKLPIGADFLADAGKVALRRGDIGIQHFRHSYGAGLTVRAGGLPVIYFLYAWGGDKDHAIGIVSPSLLGGSSRPSLF